MTDQWLLKLKAAYQGGYYRTEADVEYQSGFPWQSRRCDDCPFWMNDVCQVTLTRCFSGDVPCAYFDPLDHEEARRLIVERLRAGWKRRSAP
jgi:hypothetical protein